LGDGRAVRLAMLLAVLEDFQRSAAARLLHSADQSGQSGKLLGVDALALFGWLLGHER
jgi:hypothetical protein